MHLSEAVNTPILNRSIRLASNKTYRHLRCKGKPGDSLACPGLRAARQQRVCQGLMIRQIVRNLSRGGQSYAMGYKYQPTPGRGGFVHGKRRHGRVVIDRMIEPSGRTGMTFTGWCAMYRRRDKHADGLGIEPGALWICFQLLVPGEVRRFQCIAKPSMQVPSVVNRSSG